MILKNNYCAKKDTRNNCITMIALFRIKSAIMVIQLLRFFIIPYLYSVRSTLQIKDNNSNQWNTLLYSKFLLNILF